MLGVSHLSRLCRPVQRLPLAAPSRPGCPRRNATSQGAGLPTYCRNGPTARLEQGLSRCTARGYFSLRHPVGPCCCVHLFLFVVFHRLCRYSPDTFFLSPPLAFSPSAEWRLRQRFEAAQWDASVNKTATLPNVTETATLPNVNKTDTLPNQPRARSPTRTDPVVAAAPTVDPVSCAVPLLGPKRPPLPRACEHCAANTLPARSDARSNIIAEGDHPAQEGNIIAEESSVREQEADTRENTKPSVCSTPVEIGVPTGGLQEQTSASHPTPPQDQTSASHLTPPQFQTSASHPAPPSASAAVQATFNMFPHSSPSPRIPQTLRDLEPLLTTGMLRKCACLTVRWLQYLRVITTE